MTSLPLMGKLTVQYLDGLGIGVRGVMDTHVDYTSREYWNGIIKMGLSKFFILRVLYDRPMHGYEIAQTVAQVTKGCCTPSEGTIYPVLREFEQGGYVESSIEVVNGRERRVYTLTGQGRLAFKIGVEAWREVTQYILQARP